MLFSIIIPVYNSEMYAAKSINSVISQSISDYELILVDDGSTDRSSIICNAYAESYPFIRVYHQDNQGHTAARNAGLRVARGEYILFVDSDDWLDATILEDCRGCILRYEPDIVFFGYRRVGTGTAVEKPQPYPLGYYSRERLEQIFFPTLLVDGRFSLSERIFRRDLLIEAQADVDRQLLLGEDLACCVLSLVKAKSAYVLEGVYYNYLQHDGSVSHVYKNYYFENWFVLRDCIAAEASKFLPDFDKQAGYCSIRFLHRAVLGEFARNGKSVKTRDAILSHLKQPRVISDLKAAKKYPLSRNYRFKVFCLEHKLIYLLYFADKTVHRIRGGW